MSNNVLELYGKKCTDLISSLVIKSEITADRINNEIIVRHATEDFFVPTIDPDRPETWRYYLNVAGKYHAEDSMMRVVSLDTTEVIDFTVENLKLHKATAKAYAVGQPKYKELVQQFPNQSNLIRGILNPTDINVAINAPDNTILAYDKSLVEVNEYNLINELQQEIHGFMDRWSVAGYLLISDLFPAILYGLLTCRLLTKILVLRLKYRNTNQAHSFHVNQFLIGHGFKPNDVVAMTLWQRLYLYRNIRYLRLNQGQRKTFKSSMDALLTERNIPLAEYQMHHDISKMPNELRPEVIFKTKTLNLENSALDAGVVTIDQLLAREDPVAVKNPEEKADAALEGIRQMQQAKTNNALTKALQSTVYDETNSGEYRLTDVMLSHLLDWTNLGIYKTVINIVHPVSGESITLTAEDAITLMGFCQNKIAGNKDDVIPSFRAGLTQRLVGYNQRSV